MAKKFQKSQNAHSRLNRIYLDKSNTDKNRAYANYHADCMDQQKRYGRILSKSERKKLFSWWWKSEVENKREKYPFKL